MADVPDTAPILFEVQGPLGVITLNRPKALNALNLAMIRQMGPQLAAWADDPVIAAVVIEGAGDRAFCAGGDVRAVYESGLAARQSGAALTGMPADFFREEYILNHQIHTFPKPYIAIVDGIAMGGGVGLSIHGTYRVVTDRLMLAMPETGIGLFPDVGGGWFLNRYPGALGTYFGLTGARGGAAEAIMTGYATHHVPSDRVADLQQALAAGDVSTPHSIGAILDRFHTDPDPSDLANHRDVIDRCFSADRVEDILTRLAAEPGRFAAETAAMLARHSPTSLKVTLAHLRRSVGLSYRDVVTLEYRLSQACMAGHDFYEGIRAVLVDKDRTPKWQPSELAAVDDALVERHFAALGPRDLSPADGE